jgi:general secretion pathway protein D
LTLTLLFAAGAAFAQPAPATTAAPAATTAPDAAATGTAPATTASAAATTGAAAAATASPEAQATAPAPITTGSSEAPTTESAAATTAPAQPPSWTPVQQATATPDPTAPSTAATTAPETAPSPATTAAPETASSPDATTPPATASAPAGTVPPATASAAATTAPPSGPPPAANGHVLNFNEAPIDLVLKYLAESAGLQVVKQASMTDVRVTIIGQQPIYVDDTIALLNSALNVKGYAAIKSGTDGRILKIVTLEDAKKLNVPVHKGTQPDLIPTTDEVITQVMPLRYIDATRLRQDLTPLISASASITSNAAGNALVVTDTSANVHRIAEVVWALDTNTTGATEVRIYSLKNADATSAVKLITDIFKPDTATTGPGGFMRGMARFMMGGGGRGGGGGGGGTGSTDQTTAFQPPTLKASADTRTNSVVVTGPSESLLVVDKIIEKLESNTIEPQGVFVYALKNGTAANIAPVLNNIMGTSTSATGVGTRSTQPGMTPGSSAANSSLASQNGLYGQVYVVASADTNSLLVMTMPKYFEQVKGIIKTLDRPIPQVLIRVLIAEVTHDNTVDLGADFSFMNLTSAAITGDKYGNQLASNIAELPTPAAGGLTFTTLTRDFSTTIRALQTIGKLDVLSRPYILASDNQKANFQDVVQYPFASGSRADVNGNVDTTVTWQTLGISLNVTPHINPDGIVTMLINPEIDTLTGQVVQIQAPSSTSGGLSEQVWGKRIATSQVAVRNGQTIVIGGMIQDSKTDTINKIPFLGDIPYVGRIFQHTVTARTKTEVLIFLTPMVAMNPQELKALSKVEEQGAGKELYDAVDPGTYQQHLNAMGAQVPPQGAPTQPDSPQAQSPQTPAPQTQSPQTQTPPADATQPPAAQTPNK